MSVCVRPCLICCHPHQVRANKLNRLFLVSTMNVHDGRESTLFTLGWTKKPPWPHQKKAGVWGSVTSLLSVRDFLSRLCHITGIQYYLGRSEPNKPVGRSCVGPPPLFPPAPCQCSTILTILSLMPVQCTCSRCAVPPPPYPPDFPAPCSPCFPHYWPDPAAVLARPCPQ